MSDDQPPQLRALAQAVSGLTYPSESDEPFEVFRWPAADGTTAREAIAAHVRPGRRIVQLPVDQFFSQLDDADDAPRFRRLRKTLESQLKDLAVFRVGEGEVQVDVYLIGRLPDGDWAGLHTVSIET